MKSDSIGGGLNVEIFQHEQLKAEGVYILQRRLKSWGKISM